MMNRNSAVMGGPIQLSQIEITESAWLDFLQYVRD
jgi:hypothetical protein